MFKTKALLATIFLLSSVIVFSQGQDCATATSLTVNYTCVNQAFSNSQNGTSPEYVASCASGGTSYEDAYYTITGTGNTITVTISGTNESYTLSAWTGCGTGQIACTNQAAGVTGSISFPTSNGVTYYIHIQRRSGGNSGDLNGNICATQPLVAPANDNCSGATPLTVNPTQTCTTVTPGTIAGATASSQSTTACGGTEDDDVWFSFTATSTTHDISLLNVAGSTTDLYHSVWSGTCPTLSLVTGSCSDPNTSTVTGLTPGQTYFIRVYSWTSTTGQTSTFNVCVGTPPPPPPPPANDECSGAFPVTVNPDLNCGSTTAGTIENATASSQNTASCSGTENDDVWFSFTATNTTHTIDLLNVVNGTTDLYHSVWTGTCPTLTLVPGTCSDPNSSTVTGLTPGTTYYIRVNSWTSSSGQTTDFDVCVGTLPPPGPCTGDMSINTTLFSGTGYTTCGFGDDYTSTDACGSSYMGGDDIVIEYTPTATQCVQIALSNTDTWVGLFITNGCPDDPGVSCLAQATNSSGNPVLNGFNVVAGTTYFITISTFPSPQCTPFDITISACPPPPPNDECLNATSLPVTPAGGTCSQTAGYTTNATTSAQANGCFGTADDDVWYSFVATSGDVQIDLSSISGSTSDMYFSVYGGSCGTPGAELLCSDPNSGQVSGLTVGNTYFIRVYTYTSSGGQSASFNICVSEIGPCGIPSASEDYCPYPATLTQGAGSWSSTTYPYYTDDTPANSGTLFCGSVENNSWYQFTALSTTETFNFTSVANCVWGDGIQAEVYEVSYDASGCCANFSSVSNCWNPGVQTTGTVTATGLTIGNQYILMVDGYAGDNCEFTVSNWTAVGIILPVELIDLGAIAQETENLIYWSTASEKDNDYFVVERSFDGVAFEPVGTVKGAGNAQQTNKYLLSDTDVRYGKVYYRLAQYDFDGTKQLSQVVTLDRNNTSVGIQSIYPNPSTDHIFVEMNLSTLSADLTLELRTLDGKALSQRKIPNNQGNMIHQMDMKPYNKGIYFVVLSDDNGFLQNYKLIKH